MMVVELVQRIGQPGMQCVPQVIVLSQNMLGSNATDDRIPLVVYGISVYN